MAEHLSIRLDPELKRKLARLATREGKTATQVVRDLIEDYVKKRDVASHIDALWERVGQRLKSTGVGARDVAGAVREARTTKARDADRR
jgi:predicted DNA-binding protein